MDDKRKDDIYYVCTMIEFVMNGLSSIIFLLVPIIQPIIQ